MYAAPLLEEERDPLRATLLSNLQHPIPSHRASVRAALSADDRPVDAGEIDGAEILKEGFHRHEPDGGGRVTERRKAWQTVRAVLDADAKPDVRQAGHPAQGARQQIVHPLVPLGQHLVDVPICPAHHVADGGKIVGGNVLVKEVTHRVDEDPPRLPPACWFIQLLRNKTEIEPLLERVARNAAKPLGEDLGVAELAAGAHLRATTYRVPRRVGPLDRGSITHAMAKIMRKRPNCQAVFRVPAMSGGYRSASLGGSYLSLYTPATRSVRQGDGPGHPDLIWAFTALRAIENHGHDR